MFPLGMGSEWTINSKVILERLKDAGLVLLHFLRNPIHGMKTLPQWDWLTIFLCQATAAAACGGLSGIVARSFGGIFLGLLVVPISTIAMCIILAAFFYYSLLLIFHTEVKPITLYTAILFASVPTMVLSVVSPLLPPLILLGVAASGLLLVVGLVETFHQDRKKMFRFVAAIYGVFVILWIFNAISSQRHAEHFREQHSPESLDILERELQNK